MIYPIIQKVSIPCSTLEACHLPGHGVIELVKTYIRAFPYLTGEVKIFSIFKVQYEYYAFYDTPSLKDTSEMQLKFIFSSRGWTSKILLR